MTNISRKPVLLLLALTAAVLLAPPKVEARNLGLANEGTPGQLILTAGKKPDCKPELDLSNPAVQKLVAALQGEWHSPQYVYSLRVENTEGFATLTNAPEHYQVGDAILCISSAQDDLLVGKQIFTDGNFYDITIEFIGDELIMEGADLTWQMVRP